VGGATGFVGREAELATLLSALERARAGRGSLYLIGGEPGIGKSRLADEFAVRARQDGARVLWGRCWEGAGAPPYWPWMQALRGFLRETDAAVTRELLGTAAADIAQMLPELRATLPESPAPPAESDSARFQLFDSTSSFVRGIAERAATIIVLDDLHAADTPSILLLRFVATQLNGMRVVLVGTFRDVELTPDHPLTTGLTELGREPITHLITLGGLAEDMAGKLIESTAGIPAADRLAREMWRETKGNPLFLGEAVRLLISERRFGDIAAGETLRLSVPAGVRDVITRRLSQLSPETVSALTVGSAIGPEFSVDLLRRVIGQRGEEVAEQIAEATRAGLVSPVSTAIGQVRFAHDLIRESLYDEQTAVARGELHLRIAESLEDEPRVAREDHLAELAYHYSEAARGAADDEAPGIALKAHEYAERAGRRALSALAYEEAARLFRAAFEALDVAHDARDELRGRLLLEMGDADSLTGDHEAAQRSYLAASDIYRRLGDAHDLALAALGYAGRVVWARVGWDTRIIPLLEEALLSLGSSDPPLRARLLTRLACALRSSPEERERSDQLSHEALEIARSLGDNRALGEAMIGRYYATFWPENHQQRAIMAREIMAVAEEAGDAELLVDAYLIQWLSETDSAQRPSSRSSLDDVTRVAHELRQPAKLWLGIGPRAEQELLEGNFDVAADLIERELGAPYPFSNARDNESAGAFHQFLLRRELANLSDSEADTRAAADAFPWYPLHRSALALLLVELGRLDEARREFAALAADSFAALYHDNEWLLGMALTSEACYLLDDRAAAEILYEQLSPFAGRHAIGHAEGSMGAVDRYLGLLSLTLGNTNRAIAHLRAAVDFNEQLMARPWTARSKHDLALALDRRGTATDGEQAADLRHAALSISQALGMPALTEQLRAELGQLDLDTDNAGAERRDGASDGLFRLEGEYWTIRFAGDEFRLRDAKGLRYLARLLQAPGHELLALDLAREAASLGESAERFETDLGSDALGDAGPALDPRAKQAYRSRVQELREELGEAESWNDPERATRAREEIDFITRELAAAVGLGGRDRPTSSPGERARVSVTRAIRLALARIAENSTALGDHFGATIHTGTYCMYRPDPRVPIDWHA
jgi:hypothetical protein